MNLVIVESPAKAKTINKYLGDDFKVIASFGHVRDIEERKGIIPEENFKIIYQTYQDKSKYINEIKSSIKNSKKLYLATDQDREGEAIAWHIKTILEESKLLNGIEVLRVTFNEITKEAILNSFKNPRDIDINLVDAYQARRSLDYLMGFSLSPLLIRKLPGCKSAGRVQSVALKIIVNREEEIDRFISKEHWSIPTKIFLAEKLFFIAMLVEVNSTKISKFDIPDEITSQKHKDAIDNSNFFIYNIEKKKKLNNPYAPFITSTLQLDASNKLNFSPSQTMSLAQKLYEGISIKGENVGLITYMRTDSINLSGEFINKTRSLIIELYGKNYISQSPRKFKSKVVNSQEAHEAIRPSNPNILPKDLPRNIDPDLIKLYELIWRRAIGTQASSSESELLTIILANKEENIKLRASGTTETFDGYKKIYREGKYNEEDKTDKLPLVESNTKILNVLAEPKQHFTEPPPRFSEASLIKKLEEYGIGRPSTYANIMKKNQERGYVKLESKKFIPQDMGRIVNGFLCNYFPNYLDYNFTAKKENELDQISKGEKIWKDMLHEFWKDFKEKIDTTLGLSNTVVLDSLNSNLEEILYPKIESKNTRKCPKCNKADLSIKMRKNGSGPFVACTSHPSCDYIRKKVFPGLKTESSNDEIEDKTLGKNKENVPIYLKNGPYGVYLQLGDKDESGKIPKRTSVPKNMKMDDLNLDQAVKLLSLPRDIGLHPESGTMIIGGIGRFGPYIKHEKEFYSLPKDDDLLSVGINRAVDIIATPKKKRAAQSKPLKIIGKHPIDKKDIPLYNGKYGHYIKYNNINITIPKSYDIDELSIEIAIELIKKKKKKKR